MENLKNTAKKIPIMGFIGRRLVAKAIIGLREAQWKSGILWPILVNTSQTWDSYVNNLSKPAYKNYKKAKKENNDVAFTLHPFSQEVVFDFMNIWEKYNSFPRNYLERLKSLAKKKWLMSFVGTLKGELIILHLVEKYDGYVRCHAPWYDKYEYPKRNLSTFMWFSLIDYAINTNEIQWLDLGGGPLNRLPKDHYKRRYAPEDVTYFVAKCAVCQFMYLVEYEVKERGRCPHCYTEKHFGPKDFIILRLSKWT